MWSTHFWLCNVTSSILYPTRRYPIQPNPTQPTYSTKVLHPSMTCYSSDTFIISNIWLQHNFSFLNILILWLILWHLSIILKRWRSWWIRKLWSWTIISLPDYGPGRQFLITHHCSGLTVFYNAPHLQNVDLIICARFGVWWCIFCLSGINKVSISLQLAIY